jgi:hypothetical protein
MKIKAIVHEAEEGGFWAEVPAIPGCASQGETMDELMANLHEAAQDRAASPSRKDSRDSGIRFELNDGRRARRPSIGIRPDRKNVRLSSRTGATVSGTDADMLVLLVGSASPRE